MNGIQVTTTSKGRTVYRIRYRVPIAPGSDRRKQKMETLKDCDSKKKAEGVLAKRVAAVFDNTYRPTGQAAIRVAEEAAAFLASTKPRDPKNVQDGELASWRSYDAAFRNHLVPRLGKLYLSEVTPAVLEDLRRKLREKETLKDGSVREALSEATIRNVMRYLQSMFAYARKQQHCTHDPVSEMSFKKIKNARKREPTEAECEKIAKYILRESDVSFFRPVLVTLYCTALRIESILSLRWENIDLGKQVARTKQKGGDWVEVQLPALLVAELRRWKPWSLGLSKSGWVFPSSRDENGHVSQTGVHKRWVKMLEACEIEDLVRHDFRRRMTTALLRAGADKAGIRLTTGHASDRMIDEHYDARQRSEIAPLLERATSLAALSIEAGEPKKSSEDDSKSS